MPQNQQKIADRKTRASKATATLLVALSSCSLIQPAQAQTNSEPRQSSQIEENIKSGAPGYDFSLPYKTGGKNQDKIDKVPAQSRSSISEEILQVARDWKLGNPQGTMTGIGGGYWAQGYQQAVVLYSPSSGPYPLAKQVYRTWLTKESGNWGAPLKTSSSPQGLQTSFKNGSYFYDARSQLVRNADRTLGKEDALVIGESQVFEQSWIGQGFKEAGYKATYFRCGGTGYLASRAKTCPSYSQGVVGNDWYLPQGDPAIVYLQGSGNDVLIDQNPEELIQAARKTLQKLQQAYPQSRIVISDVLSRKDAQEEKRAQLSQKLAKLAQQEKVSFISFKYWISDYRAHQRLRDQVHLNQQGQDYFAPHFAQSLQQAALGYTLIGGIGAAHSNTGGTARYGVPLSNELDLGDGAVAQEFSKDQAFYWYPELGAHPVKMTSAIGQKYLAGGYHKTYGYPMSAETDIPGGALQRFKLASGGQYSFYWTPELGRTHIVREHGAIGKYFLAGGGSVTYGFPTEDEAAYAHGRRQVFSKDGAQNRFYWSGTTGVHMINGHGAIFERWVDLGHGHTIGFPCTHELKAGEEGSVQYFRSAQGQESGIWFSPQTGAHPLNSQGAIYWHWRTIGYTDILGYPLTDEFIDSDGITKVRFSHGQTINWTAERGTWVSR